MLFAMCSSLLCIKLATSRVGNHHSSFTVAPLYFASFLSSGGCSHLIGAGVTDCKAHLDDSTLNKLL